MPSAWRSLCSQAVCFERSFISPFISSRATWGSSGRLSDVAPARAKPPAAMSARTIRRSQCLRQKGFFFSCRLFTKAARMTRHCRHSSFSGDVFKFPVSGVVFSILRFLLPVIWGCFLSQNYAQLQGRATALPASGHRTWKTIISGHPCSPVDRCRAWASGPSSTGSP